MTKWNLQRKYTWKTFRIPPATVIVLSYTLTRNDRLFISIKPSGGNFIKQMKIRSYSIQEWRLSHPNKNEVKFKFQLIMTLDQAYNIIEYKKKKV